MRILNMAAISTTAAKVSLSEESYAEIADVLISEAAIQALSGQERGPAVKRSPRGLVATSTRMTLTHAADSPSKDFRRRHPRSTGART
jgi:hypothetical protein